MEAVATDYSGFHMRTPYFLVYSQGRVSKIYRKGDVQEPYDPNANDPNYVLTLGPTTSPYIAALDSLVYDASGRLIANYHFTGGGALYVLNEYDILSYHSAGTPYAGLLYSVKLYDAANVLKDKIFFYEYDLTKRNPLYRAFKELALVRTVIHIRRFIPMEYYGNDFNRYVAMNPYVLTRLEARTVGYSGDVWYSYTLQNTFDAEGNLTNAAAACSGCNLGYSYIKKKK